MAHRQDDTGTMSTAGMPEVLYNDAIIKDMVFNFSSDIDRGNYPYPTSVTLGEPDADSNKERALFLDTARLPSFFTYDLESPNQADPSVFDDKARRTETRGQQPKERSKCDNCGASFARISDLRRHTIAQHSPHFTYKCTVEGCTKQFHRKDKFQEHVWRKHKLAAPPSAEDVIQKAIYQHLHDTKSLDLIPESNTSKETSQSSWTSLDMRQFLCKDTTASMGATQIGYESSEKINTTSDDNLSRNSIFAPSTSSNRSLSCRDPKEVFSMNLVGESGPAKMGLACPYRKHNPVDYNIHSHTTCATSSWEIVTRVKEHLIRHHRAPFQCTRCWTSFSAEVDLSIHLRSTNICELRQMSPAEGMTPDVERRIRSRKRRDQSEAKKWEEMYTILFPKEKEIPSPYFVPIGDDAAVRDKLVLSPNGSSLRGEFPRLFKSRLDGALARHGAPVLDATLKSQILDIVTECWDEILIAQNKDHSMRDLEYDDRKEDLQGTSAEYTFLPTAVSMADINQPNSDVDIASYCMDSEMSSLL